MQVTSDLVQLRNYREAVSKKTGELHKYIDIFDEAGELTVNTDAVNVTKVHLMRPYKMVAKIEFRKIGLSQIAVLKALKVTPAKFDYSGDPEEEETGEPDK